MAEAAALALAARVNESLNFDNTTFLSDCQQLVHFLNQQDHTHPQTGEPNSLLNHLPIAWFIDGQRFSKSTGTSTQLLIA
jgi:hypothetical protein